MKQLIVLLSLCLLVSSCSKDDPTSSCTDGILNGSETGIDCGGSDCSPCPTCFDNIQNGNETGIDCGGNCNPCPTLGCTDPQAHNYSANATQDDGSCETCTDGILNGDEMDVDCGGILCSPCIVEGCTDPDAHN